jgi:tellurite resistance protein TehA-like permease
MKLNFVSQPLYLFAICFVKLSIGFFLLRIAVHRFYRRLIIGIMGMLEIIHGTCHVADSAIVFMGVYSVGCFFTIVLQCTDLRLLWDPTVKGGTCWTAHTLKSLSYANQALNIFTDVAFSVAIPVLPLSVHFLRHTDCFRYP